MGLRLQSSTMAHVRALALALMCALTGAWAAITPAAQGAEGACPNEARRVEQNATFLPDCRAFEKVSPAQKGGGDIVGEGDTTIAGNLSEEAFARGEGAVVFNTRTPFGDSAGTGVDGQSTYVARRGADGWTSHGATPSGRPDALQAFFLMTKLDTFSEDLSSGIVWGYDLPGGGGTPERNNIYQEDTGTRALQALGVSQAAALNRREFLPVNEELWGVSADAQHVAFVASYTQMLPNAAEGAPNVYQWDAGKGLSLAGILPDGKVSESGSEAQPNYRASMSADGSRMVFTAVPDNDPNGDRELYMRIDENMTVPISTPAGSPVFSTNVHLQAVTPDGRNVFFVTDSPLVAEDTNNGPDLYRWTDSGDAAHDGTLTAITTAGGFGLWSVQATGVIGVSDDGSRVYYQTLGGGLVVWDNGTEKVVSPEVPGNAEISLAAIASKPGYGRVSADGEWLAFLSDATFENDRVHPIAPDPAGTPVSELTLEKVSQYVGGAAYEMYVYSLRTGDLVCVSCFSGGVIPNAAMTPDVTNGTPVLSDTAIRPNFLSGDGKVFFSTSGALVPEDVNGVEDVYEYDGATGTLHLVSSGTGSDPASFADASRSGKDVFIESRQQLLSEDGDNLVDLYDVRVGGGFPAPVSPGPCSGDECQPQPAPAPGFGAPASVGFSGAGNVSAAVGKPVVKGQSNKQKLAKALRACKRRHGRVRRKQCEARARRRYGKNAKSLRGSK